MAAETKERVPFDELPFTPKVKADVEADIKRLRKLEKQRHDSDEEVKLIKASLFELIYEAYRVEAVELHDGAVLSLFMSTRDTLSKKLLLDQGVSPRIIEEATTTSAPFAVVKITEAKKG